VRVLEVKFACCSYLNTTEDAEGDSKDGVIAILGARSWDPLISTTSLNMLDVLGNEGNLAHTLGDSVGVMETVQLLENDVRPAKRAKGEAGTQGETYNSYELNARALSDKVASAASELGAAIEDGHVKEGGRQAGLALQRILEPHDELGKLLSSAGVTG
jgi:hypothetical protein